MNLTEFWAEGIKLNNEFQNNLISSSQQDMSNWDIEGEEGTITFSYEDAINTLTFENDGENGFNKNISLSITNLESNCFYTVKFKACSPSGFVASDVNNIIITGDTTQSGKISNTASNDLVEYKFVVFSEGNINIKFDLKQMINTSTDIILKIKEIGLYKLSGPGLVGYWKNENDNIITDENNEGFIFL